MTMITNSSSVPRIRSSRAGAGVGTGVRAESGSRAGGDGVTAAQAERSRANRKQVASCREQVAWRMSQGARNSR
jgi:hypothetical protein